MWANHNMTQAKGAAPQQLVMKVLALVTEIMVDDLALAEQMRMAAMTIWLSERQGWDPRRSSVTWRDLQRGEQQLRRLLYEALQQGYLCGERFDHLMALLGQFRRQQQPIIASAVRRWDERTDRINLPV